LAKPELLHALDKIRSQITVDKKSESVLIRNLLIRDYEVYEFVSDQKEMERPEFVKKALKVGAIALRDVVVAEKIDYVQREFEKLCFELEKIFTQKLGKEGMKGELDKIFSDKGELHGCLEKVFGSDGKLARDILDMNNARSPIGQLKKTIEAYFVGKNSELYNMLDPNAKDSPIARLRKEILDKMQTIENTITTNIATKEAIQGTPKKGFIFEDMLESFLLQVSKPFGDTIDRVGKERGKLNNLKGDFVITLHDPTIKGQRPKIVVEAKTREKLSLSAKGVIGELRGAIENREALFAIAVTDKVISDDIGAYREYEGDKIICAFEDDGLPLEVAYRAARAYILMKIHETPDKIVDINRICGIISKISTDLNSVRGIKAKLTSIGNTAEAIDDDIGLVEQNIRNSLRELQELLSFTSN
jgi:hypothetical protein